MRSYLKENPSQKSSGGMAQGECPEFKPQNEKKNEINGRGIKFIAVYY
jgi:hypothetical protein